jgi:hypothetical protein
MDAASIQSHKRNHRIGVDYFFELTCFLRCTRNYFFKTQWSKQSDPSRVPNTLNMDIWNGDTVVAGLEMLRNVFRVATQEAEVEGLTLRCLPNPFGSG